MYRRHLSYRSPVLFHLFFFRCRVLAESLGNPWHFQGLTHTGRALIQRNSYVGGRQWYRVNMLGVDDRLISTLHVALGEGFQKNVCAFHSRPPTSGRLIHARYETFGSAVSPACTDTVSSASLPHVRHVFELQKKSVSKVAFLS